MTQGRVQPLLDAEASPAGFSRGARPGLAQAGLAQAAAGTRQAGRLIRDYDRAQERQEFRRHRVGGDGDHPGDRAAARRGRHGVGRERERELAATVTRQHREARLGPCEYLDWQQNCPAKAG